MLDNGIIYNEDGSFEVLQSNVQNNIPKIKVLIGNFCGDTPARNFVLGTKYHTGYFGCGRCNTEGEYLVNRTCFPELNAVLRTDEGFKNKIHEEHHKKNTILETINFKCISQAPLDSMHLLYPGVMKKMVFIWLKGTKHEMKHRISTQQQNMINDALVLAKNTQPVEFSRRIRPITDFTLFKATEFRTLLMYTGMVAFSKTLPQNAFDIFLLLSCGIRLLNDKTQFKLNNVTAKNMLHSFVVQFGNYFGNHLISYNVHNVVHLADETIVQNAPLDEFACWIFESYNSTLKQFGRKQNSYLQQAYNRTMENYRTAVYMNEINKKKVKNPPYFDKIVRNKSASNTKYFDEVKFAKFSINTTAGNKWFITNDDKIVEFTEAIEMCDNENQPHRVIRGRPIINCIDYFIKPIKSSYLGIYKSSKCEYGDFQTFELNEIETKIFCIKNVDGENVFISMLF